MEKEKKLVTLSMVVLFFSLIVVYSLFYQIKGEKILNSLQSGEGNSQNQNSSLQKKKVVSEKIETININLLTGDSQETITLEGDQISDISTGNDALQVESGGNQNASSDHLNVDGESPIMLSGTDLYFGAIESIELLGLEPEYLLKDKKGFYYAKFNTEPDLKQVVQDLGGNIYTITTESELIKNKLFGDKISFINLPEYKNRIVLMMLSYNNEYWLIHLDYDKYHHSKEYLKNLFITI